MQARPVERVLSTLRGSSWPVLVSSAGEKLVVKLRGSAEGVRPLIAELVVGALADALGLLTPERYLVELSADVASDDPHEELRDLLRKSAGLNLGLRYLEGFRNVTVGDAGRIRPELQAQIAWLDAFVQNPDRTERNPNLMIKSGQIWLIDHGAALHFHHDWPQLAEADRALAPKLQQDTLQAALDSVPDAFFAELGPEPAARQRAAYVAYLRKRAREPRPFVAQGKRVPFQF